MRKKKKKEPTKEELNMENPETEVQDNAQDTSETSDKDQEIQELKDKYLRLYAEFDNYKKRTVKEKMDLMLTAAQDTMSALLPVLDDFDRAKKNADDESSPEEFTEGVSMIYNKIYNVLKQKGLQPMDSTGEVFDPELHEAITEIPAPSDDMKGKIIDTVERGYRLNERIIRHAKVVVGK
ncbi:MAG: nucleotide exchange factor GrpE [Bacteroidetes bacterium]|nr:nucleotide exchange factor GrpE [Bacteroidota bacterium]